MSDLQYHSAAAMLELLNAVRALDYVREVVRRSIAMGIDLGKGVESMHETCMKLVEQKAVALAKRVNPDEQPKAG
jgi:hypothetical protein